MTTVKFFIGDNRLNGFEISGHSGFSIEYSDIVCAAISSSVLMTANTITEVIGDNAQIKQSEGFLSFSLENGSESSYKVLSGLRLHLTEISKQYPRNIRIIYGGKQNA